MNIGILDAGNVALANAVWLADKGHDVHVWTALGSERIELSERKLAVEGIIEGTASIAVATQVSTAIDGAELVMIAALAFAHADLVSSAAPNDHVVMAHPVTGLSSLLLSRRTAERKIAPLIIDAATSLFTARKSGPTTVGILASALCERDFVAEGDKLEHHGIAGLSSEEVLTETMNGFAA